MEPNTIMGLLVMVAIIAAGFAWSRASKSNPKGNPGGSPKNPGDKPNKV